MPNPIGVTYRIDLVNGGRFPVCFLDVHNDDDGNAYETDVERTGYGDGCQRSLPEYQYVDGERETP